MGRSVTPEGCVVAGMTGSSGNDTALVLLATSVAVAVRSCAPVDSGEVITVQLPAALVVVVPTNAVPSLHVQGTVCLAVPLNCTCEPLTMESLTSTGALGATVRS